MSRAVLVGALLAVAAPSMLPAQATRAADVLQAANAAGAANAGQAVNETQAADAPGIEELLSPPTSELAALVSRFTSDRDGLLRFHDLESETRRQRLARFYTSWEARLDEVPFESLGVEGRIDYLLLRNRLRYELRRLDVHTRLAEEIEPLLPFEPALVELHLARRRLEPVDPRQAAEALDRATEAVRTARAAVPDPLRTTPVVANRALSRIQDLRRVLDSWFTHFDGYDPRFGWWVREPYSAFVQEIDAYVSVLRQELVGIRPGEEEPVIGDPLGREALLLDLEMELIPYTPEELIAIAERELAWGEREMAQAAEELGFGGDWHAALEHVKSLHVPPGEQTELVRYLAREAEELVEDADLVSVPPLAREIWRMVMLSPETQRIAPFFFGGEVVQVAYPTDGMAHQDKIMSLRANNRHFTRNAVQHELIPGHHLQGFMVERYNPHRRAFSTPFWQEGWALYWEMLLWDLDFAESPEDRIGMLFWRNHRAARIIFSLRFHLGEMTPDEAIDFLVDRGGHERASATAEVRRSFLGTYSPLYQVAYMIGGLQFRSLYQELVENGEMADREFHDHILRRGSIPVEMVRMSLRNELPERDFQPSWRFHEAVLSDSP